MGEELGFLTRSRCGEGDSVGVGWRGVGGLPRSTPQQCLGSNRGGGCWKDRGTVLGDGCRRGDIVGVWGVGWGGGGEGNSVGRPLSGGDPMPDSFLAAR